MLASKKVVSRSPAAATVAPASAAVVAARDKAIVDALYIRPRTTEALFDVLPDEPDLTLEQRMAARDSALIRLRVRKVIVQNGDGWTIA